MGAKCHKVRGIVQAMGESEVIGMAMEEIKSAFDEIRAGAELLKALAHPIRLCIVRGLLESGSCNVTTMQSCLEIPQSTVSQHLAKLRDLGIIAGDRQGLEVFYKVVSPAAIRVVAALFPDVEVAECEES